MTPPLTIKGGIISERKASPFLTKERMGRMTKTQARQSIVKYIRVSFLQNETAYTRSDNNSASSRTV